MSTHNIGFYGVKMNYPLIFIKYTLFALEAHRKGGDVEWYKSSRVSKVLQLCDKLKTNTGDIMMQFER